jgi:hypothetical protein
MISSPEFATHGPQVMERLQYEPAPEGEREIRVAIASKPQVSDGHCTEQPLGHIVLPSTGDFGLRHKSSILI